MRSGDLDRRITIMRYVVTGDDGYGNEVYDWVEHVTVWAAVTQASGREFLHAAAIEAERKVVFRTHWQDGITEADRVTYDGRLHNINETRELGRREGLELHTTTMTA